MKTNFGPGLMIGFVVKSSQMQATETRTRIPVATVPPTTPSGQQRYLALDAFRGFIMFVLVSRGFGLEALAKRNPAFSGIANQFEHMPWEWITFWDLIQPAFMFMVGERFKQSVTLLRQRACAPSSRQVPATFAR